MVRVLAAGLIAVVLVGCGGAAPGGPGLEPDAGEGEAATQVDAGPDSTPNDVGSSQDSAPPPSCTSPSAWYPDADGDGFGDVHASPTMACAAPAHFVSDHTDCADTDANAHAGQTNWFTNPIQGGSGFDYDCDGKEEQEYTGTSLCYGGSGAPGQCVGQVNAWYGGTSTTVACGASAQWMISCTHDPAGCIPDTIPQTQACH